MKASVRFPASVLRVALSWAEPAKDVSFSRQGVELVDDEPRLTVLESALTRELVEMAVVELEEAEPVTAANGGPWEDDAAALEAVPAAGEPVCDR